MNDSQIFAHYPFLRESSKYVRENGPTLHELLDGREYTGVRARGRERVIGALEKEEIPVGQTSSQAACFTEILSYPIARMLVSVVNDPFLTRRYALVEAKRARKLMEREATPLVLKIAYELGLEASVDEGRGRKMAGLESLSPHFKIHFADYLRFSGAMRGGHRGEWKLVNQELSRGEVRLSYKKFLRIVQQAIQIKIETELPLKLDKVVINKFKDDVRDIRAKIETYKKTYHAEDIGKRSIINLPPCMRRLLAMAQAGENIPHQGRFALTAFLHALGMSSDDIINLFSLSPDFDSKKSKYQVEHITGVISSTEYTPPECGTMRTYGICFEPDYLCKKDWMTHPLKYYRTKTGRRAGKGGAGDKGNEKKDEGAEDSATKNEKSSKDRNPEKM